MNRSVIYLIVLCFIVKADALNSRLGRNKLSKLFHHVKDGVVKEHERKKKLVMAHVKSLKEGNRRRRSVFDEELDKLREEDKLDQGMYRRDSDLTKKYHLVGSSDKKSLSGEHRVKESDLKALQLELEKRVVDDIDTFVKKVEAY